MPKHSRYLVKAALLYFGVGLTLGMALLVQKAAGIDVDIWSLLPFHIEIMLFGWLIQFVMGVAYWMLPRYLKGPPRGKSWKAWTLWGCFNLGILWNLLVHLTLPSYLTLIGRTFQVIAIILFVHLHWPRLVVLRRKVPKS